MGINLKLFMDNDGYNPCHPHQYFKCIIPVNDDDYLLSTTLPGAPPMTAQAPSRGPPRSAARGHGAYWGLRGLVRWLWDGRGVFFLEII